MEVVVEMIQDCSEEGIIGGGNSTKIALKDQNSFLIGSFMKGVKVFEDGKLVYSQKLDWFRSMIYTFYSPSLNCYYVASHRYLYKKDINGKPPVFLIEHLMSNFEVGNFTLTCLTYSKIHESS